MHGSIFVELREYVGATYGAGQWEAVLDGSGIGHKDYVANQVYPDLDAVRIVAAAADRTGRPLHELLEDFGEYLAASLIERFVSLVDPGWKTLDLLEHVEETIHTVIRASNARADPPRLRCRRLSRTEVVVEYDSPRKMCSLAKGLIRGLARFYGDPIVLEESACMLKGDAACELNVRLGDRR